MPSEKVPFYDPVPPTYDEALASGSRRDSHWPPPRSPVEETESQSLLPRSGNAASSSRRPHGYQQPTAQTDDVDSLWDSHDDSPDDSDGDSDEAAHVRQEMQEMDMEEPERPRGRLWGKTIGFSGFSLSLPRWKWSWRPRIPRLRIQLPSRAAEPESDADGTQEEETASQARRWEWPKISSMTLIVTFARLAALFIIIGFFYFLFASGFFGGYSSRLSGGFRFNAEDLRAFLQKSVDPMRMRASVKHFSSYAHIAGTEGDYATAMDVQSMFTRAGLEEIRVDEYYVYINYPRVDGRAVQIMDKNGQEAIWTARLEEDEAGGETAGHQTLAFHGHSRSGDVKGPLIYANYGSRQDFKKLTDKGINTHGAIALVRHYGTQGDQALKVKAAEMAGFAGCLVYSDPADDGFRKGDVAPGGRYMPADGIQRGSVSLTSYVVGDVLTPGWESKKGALRMKVDEAPGLVKIPSLPLAWRDAQELLKALKGHGEKVSDDWKGGVPDVGEWWTGDGSSPVVRLKNEQDENPTQPIWNVYGKIIGMEQDTKSIIIGNHRDAWAFGATGPHSGTAIMVEIARILGGFVERGWRPLRTIEFMSWDAEEYNLIGSTEYVENNLDSLRQNAFAYINLDTVVHGSELHASGSPVFERALLRALDRVIDPNFNTTLREQWDRRGGQLEGLGASSDYVAFQDIAGTSSLDLEFAGDGFPQHSSYDNFRLVEQIIDPGFVYHALMGQVVGLLLLDLSDRAILPFDMTAYPRRLKKWVEELEAWASVKVKEKGPEAQLSFQDLKDSVDIVKQNTERFAQWELKWEHLVSSSGGWEAKDVEEVRMKYNNIMSQFETKLLDVEQFGGIPNRTQFKHVVFGPELWSTNNEAFFPAIRDCVEANEWDLAKEVLAKTAAILRNAATVFEG